jgi:hypothetical protein
MLNRPAAEGKPLHYRGQRRSSQGYLYRSTQAQCQGCPQKRFCTRGRYRRLFVHWQEPARQTVRALAGTPAYKQSQRARYNVEALFAELKQQMRYRARSTGLCKRLVSRLRSSPQPFLALILFRTL